MGLGDEVGVKAVQEAETKLLPELSAEATALVTAAKDALAEVVKQASVELDEAWGGAVHDLQFLMRDALAGVANTIDGLDGWTLTIEPITIRLNKPKGPQ